MWKKMMVIYMENLPKKLFINMNYFSSTKAMQLFSCAKEDDTIEDSLSR